MLITILVITDRHMLYRLLHFIDADDSLSSDSLSSDALRSDLIRTQKRRRCCLKGGQGPTCITDGHPCEGGHRLVRHGNSIGKASGIRHRPSNQDLKVRIVEGLQGDDHASRKQGR